MTTLANATFRSTDDFERSLSTAFDVLENRHRRDVLRFLSRRDGAVTLEELIEGIAATGESTPARVDHLRSALYHRQLPKMTDAGVVSYDRGADAIQCAPDADRLVDLLELAERTFEE